MKIDNVYNSRSSFFSRPPQFGLSRNIGVVRERAAEKYNN